MDTLDQSSKESPITVVISRRIRKGCEQKYEQLSAKMTEAAGLFSGYQGATLFRPTNTDDPEYRIIFKFDNQEHLDVWLASEERSRWLKDIEDLLIEPSAMDVMSGLVTWFSLPGQNPVKPPPKFKMAVVTWLAIFPTVTLIFWLFGELLLPIPLVPRTFLVTLVIVSLMTYIIMPLFTKWFAFWLFPKEEREIR